MKTLIIIHGADSFLTEEAYLDFLREQHIPRNIDIWQESDKTEWKKEIAKKWTMHDGIVYMPTMPNKQRAIYRDWKMLFEQLIQNIPLESEVTFIGSSLGGCFFLKYFSEIDSFHLPISAVHLVSACISEGDFTTPENYDILRSLGHKVHIWHAEDDIVVPFATAKILEAELPESQTHFFGVERGYGHFHGIEGFPELESVIFKK